MYFKLTCTTLMSQRREKGRVMMMRRRENRIRI
jgi:hypothetical protein